MAEKLFTKRGKRYLPWGNAWDYKDTMRAGEFRLTYCYSDGGRRYSYNVKPDTAGFLAAAEIARDAIEKAVAERASHRTETAPYTKKQVAIVEQFRRDMIAAGGLVPLWWTGASGFELADAAIAAIRNYKP